MPLKRWSGYGRLLIVIMVSLNLGLVSWKPITVNSVYKLIKYCWVKTKIGRYPFQNCTQWQYLFLFGGWIELQGEISVEYDKKPEPHQKFTKRAILEIRICSLNAHLPLKSWCHLFSKYWHETKILNTLLFFLKRYQYNPIKRE